MNRFFYFLAACLAAPLFSHAGEKPNVIIIFTDDHGYSDLGVQRVFEDLKTPHLDALAEGGARFTNGYSTAPQCIPSRGGLLSGMYQNRFGLESNPEWEDEAVMSRFDELELVGERLQSVGYVTGMAGKWHLGPPAEIVNHGFDKIFHKNSARPGTWNMDFEGKDLPVSQQSGSGYHLDLISDFACSFVDRFHEGSFFFYLSYRAPHVPLDAPDKYLSRFPGEMPERRRQALAMLSAVDDGVGRLVETLRRHELEEDTLIFLMGDNGAPLKIHKVDAPGGGPGWDGSLNDPLNGEKGMLAEGGIRVPFLASWRGMIPGGIVYDEPVITLDATVTALSIAGLPDDPSLDGVNLIPYLTGQKNGPPHEVLYWRWIDQAAMRKGKWKYLRGGDREYLFDLHADISETKNLLAEFPEIAAPFRAELEAWSETLSPPGLKSGPLFGPWGDYFDWYLDGKRDLKPRQPKKQAGPSEEELFTSRDRSKDGSVTWEEYLAGRTGPKVPEIRKHFERRDLDQNGIWERSEVQAE